MQFIYATVTSCVSCLWCYPRNTIDYNDSVPLLYNTIELEEPEELSPVYLTDKDLMELYGDS